MSENFVNKYIEESIQILSALDSAAINELAGELEILRANKGRLFLLGVGGSAGTATHAVNDFRKICHIETYTPTDNVSELSARINDEGWENCFAAWLEGSNLNYNDAVLILSVGGGNKDKNVSMNIVKALEFAESKSASIFGIVGKDGGFTKKVANVCVVIPPLFSDKITPHTEGLASVILHLIVSHPSLKMEMTKWESIK